MFSISGVPVAQQTARLGGTVSGEQLAGILQSLVDKYDFVALERWANGPAIELGLRGIRILYTPKTPLIWLSTVYSQVDVVSYDWPHLEQGEVEMSSDRSRIELVRKYVARLERASSKAVASGIFPPLELPEAIELR